MAYALHFSDTFRADVTALDKTVKQQLRKKLEKIKDNPFSSKPIGGKQNRFTTRISNFRLVYDVIKIENKVMLLAFKHRDEIYRHFY